MTTKQADALIAAGVEVEVRSKYHQEQFKAVFVRQDRRLIYSAAGGAFDRADLEVVG